MLLTAILLLLSPGLGEARRRKELPIDREPGEAGTQQRAKASGEQSRCKREILKKDRVSRILNLLSAAVGALQREGTVRQFFGWSGQVALGRLGLAEPIMA